MEETGESARDRTLRAHMPLCAHTCTPLVASRSGPVRTPRSGGCRAGGGLKLAQVLNGHDSSEQTMTNCSVTVLALVMSRLCYGVSVSITLSICLPCDRLRRYIILHSSFNSISSKKSQVRIPKIFKRPNVAGVLINSAKHT